MTWSHFRSMTCLYCKPTGPWGDCISHFHLSVFCPGSPGSHTVTPWSQGHFISFLRRVIYFARYLHGHECVSLQPLETISSCISYNLFSCSFGLYQNLSFTPLILLSDCFTFSIRMKSHRRQIIFSNIMGITYNAWPSFLYLVSNQPMWNNESQ